MSFDLPSVLPRPEHGVKPSFHENEFGIPDKMISGLSTVESELTPKHPLEESEKKFIQNQQNLQFATLRNIQGLHAPLRLMMEQRAALQVRRLPCLRSSYLMYDALTGRDEAIGFEDILNNQEDSEALIHPHIAIERSLGLLF